MVSTCTTVALTKLYGTLYASPLLPEDYSSDVPRHVKVHAESYYVIEVLKAAQGLEAEELTYK